MRIGPGAAWRDFDVAVVGGGINGCGIAREAAGRGFSVFLCERDDLASGTSSASTKLIHGGLRYPSSTSSALVRQSLSEREILGRMAPHIIRPLRFVLPHHAGLRPSWLLRLGLFLYDHLAGRTRLPGTRSLDLRSDPAGEPLKPGYRFGLEYSDCWVEDARLVVLTAMDAAARGAIVRSRTPCVAAARDGHAWAVTVEDAATGIRSQVRARMLVEMPRGPWVDRVLASVESARSSAGSDLVQGSTSRSPAVRTRPLLRVPECRPPRDLRDPVRARLHPHRHHRARLSRRPRLRRPPARRRSPTSAARPTSISGPRSPRPTSCGRTPGCVRSTTTAHPTRAP